MVPIIALAQFFFTFPIYNFFNKDFNQIRFKWISIKTFLSMLFLFFGIFSSLLHIVRVVETGLTLDSFGGILFFVQSSLASWILITIAKNWKYFIAYWSKQEYVFLRYPYTINGRKLGTKIRIIVYSLFCIAICKYTFVIKIMSHLLIMHFDKVSTYCHSPQTFTQIIIK